jgi:hypothetical protein
MRAVEQLPEMDGILDEKAIDRHLLKVHWEMQRLAEEFEFIQAAWWKRGCWACSFFC